jgi:hypothetical protein
VLKIDSDMAQGLYFERRCVVSRKAYHILAQGLFLLKMMCYREVLCDIGPRAEIKNLSNKCQQ